MTEYAAESDHESFPRKAWMNDTVGLKCAPLRGPRSAINVANTATVAPVLAISATARFPPARRSAMTPEPTTVAASNKEPKPSANNRRGRGSACIVRLADCIHLNFDAHLIDAGDWQT